MSVCKWGYQRETNPLDKLWGSSRHGSAVITLTGIQADAGCRRGSDPAVLWLWCRPAAAALIRPLARELSYAACMALKRKRKKKLWGSFFAGSFQGRGKVWGKKQDSLKSVSTAADAEDACLTQGSQTALHSPSHSSFSGETEPKKPQTQRKQA